MSKVRTLLLLAALATLFLLPDAAFARGGRGGGSRAGGRTDNPTRNLNRNRRRDDKKQRQIDSARALAEDRDAIRRDALIDSL